MTEKDFYHCVYSLKQFAGNVSMNKSVFVLVIRTDYTPFVFLINVFR